MSAILLALFGAVLLVLVVGGLIDRNPQPMDTENPFEEMNDK